MPSATRGLFYNLEIPPASRKQIFPPRGICCCLILLVLLGRKSQRTRVNLKKDISTSTCSWAPEWNTPAPYQGGYRCCQDLARCSAGSEDLKALNIWNTFHFISLLFPGWKSMPGPAAAPAPLQRGLSPSPQISALIQKLLKGWVFLSFDSGVGFVLFVFFFCMQEFGFSIRTHTTALGTQITWQPPGTAPKPSSPQSSYLIIIM